MTQNLIFLHDFPWLFILPLFCEVFFARFFLISLIKNCVITSSRTRYLEEQIYTLIAPSQTTGARVKPFFKTSTRY